MRPARVAAWLVLMPALAGAANQAPEIDHQPNLCTVPAKAVSVCATVSDDNQVARVRLYFRRAGDTYYSAVDLTFGGISFCGTIPAPREGKVATLEYYVQAIDEQYEASRTSTFQLPVQSDAICEFPPIEKDAARRAAIKVFATHKKQGKKLADGFDPAGVTFVPLESK
jgi:hypothetical protein